MASGCSVRSSLVHFVRPGPAHAHAQVGRAATLYVALISIWFPMYSTVPLTVCSSGSESRGVAWERKIIKSSLYNIYRIKKDLERKKSNERPRERVNCERTPKARKKTEDFTTPM